MMEISSGKPHVPVTTPLAQEQRISILDTIRGYAILGILLMNIPYFSDAVALASNPFIRNESGWDFYTWLIIDGAFEGTMRATFSMLFGAGAVLLLRRLERNPGIEVTPADIYYRRLLWLLCFGLVNAFIFTWPGDILYTYAVTGLFIYPFRNMKVKGLLLMALLFILVATTFKTYEWYEAHEKRVKGEHATTLKKSGTTLNMEQEGDLQAWNNNRERRSAASMMENIKASREAAHGNYLTVFRDFSRSSVMIQTRYFYFDLFWDAIAFFFIGMALFKTAMITGDRSQKFYLVATLVCLAIGYLLSYHAMRWYIALKMDSSYYLEKIGPNLYQFRRLFQALGYMSFVILLYKVGIFSRLWTWLSRVGQMAFTNYLMQTIICGFIFYGWGLGKFGTMARHETYYVVFAVWIFQIIFSNIWLKYFRFGPFEWAWRSLTYWKKQPMRKEAAGGRQ
jgi:uncharacterized protein